MIKHKIYTKIENGAKQVGFFIVSASMIALSCIITYTMGLEKNENTFLKEQNLLLVQHVVDLEQNYVQFPVMSYEELEK